MTSFTFAGTDFSGASYALQVEGFQIPASLMNGGGHHPAASGERALHTDGGRRPGMIEIPCWVTGTSLDDIDTKLANIRQKLTVAEENTLIFPHISSTRRYYGKPQSFSDKIKYQGFTASFDVPFFLSSFNRYEALQGAQNVHLSGQSKNYTMGGNEYSPRALFTILAHAGDTGDITITDATTGEYVTIDNGILNGETLVYNTWYQTLLVGTTDRRADLIKAIWSLKYGTNAISVTTENGVAVTMTVQAEGAFNP